LIDFRIIEHVGKLLSIIVLPMRNFADHGIEAVVVFFCFRFCSGAKADQVVTVSKSVMAKMCDRSSAKLNSGTRGHEVLNLRVDREMTRNLSRYD
jgi:hypothetical protein